MRNNKLVRWSALVMLGAALAACGGGKSSPKAVKTIAKADYVTQANAICKDGDNKVKALTQPTVEPSAVTTKDLAAWADYFDSIGGIAADMKTKLNALPSPDADQDKVGAFLDSFGPFQDHLKTTVDAAKAGKVDDFKSELDKLSTATEDANAKAKTAGLADCSD